MSVMNEKPRLPAPFRNFPVAIFTPLKKLPPVVYVVGAAALVWPAPNMAAPVGRLLLPQGSSTQPARAPQRGESPSETPKPATGESSASPIDALRKEIEALKDSFKANSDRPQPAAFAPASPTPRENIGGGAPPAPPSLPPAATAGGHDGELRAATTPRHPHPVKKHVAHKPHATPPDDPTGGLYAAEPEEMLPSHKAEPTYRPYQGYQTYQTYAPTPAPSVYPLPIPIPFPFGGHGGGWGGGFPHHHMFGHMFGGFHHL